MDNYTNWVEHCQTITEEFKKDNFFVNEYENDSKLVVIYFSSHALFYPDVEEEVIKAIVKDNRYDWKHYKIGAVKREIYVRDIHKCWYITGINERITCIDDLVKFFKQYIDDGDHLVTVGSSAGGFAAALFGALLGADYVFDFCGQNNINDNRKPDHFLERNALQQGHYYSIAEVYGKETRRPEVFYFYAGKNDEDVRNYNMVKNLPKWHCVGFDTTEHSDTMYRFNYPMVLNMDYEVLMGICDTYQEGITKRLDFSIAVCGFIKTYGILFARAVKKIFKKLGKR